MTDAAPQRKAIQTSLERLLAWPDIARSPQLARFLDYIVQRTLDGDEQAIKAYSIAVDVFGRPADFDPQADPIVRVQARRLRALLEDYYQGQGADEPVQIRLPVGRYIPDFRLAPSLGTQLAPVPAAAVARSPPRSLRSVAAWLALALVAMGLALTAYLLGVGGPSWTGPSIDRPSIAIVEFQNLASARDNPIQVAGLAIELVTDLEQFRNIDVRYGGTGADPTGTGALPENDYVLTGIARQDGSVVQYSAILTERSSETVVWDHTLTIALVDALAPDLLDRVSQSLSLVLGSPRGPLHAAARQSLATGLPAEGPMSSYLCQVLFDLYRETGSAGSGAQARDCLQSLAPEEQATPVALAMAASLMAEVGDAAAALSLPERRDMAQSRLDTAIALDPLSGFVWEQQARLHETAGALDEARQSYHSSVQLNPASADALAAYARLLAFGGDLASAQTMARDAAAASPSAPPWYHGVPALVALRDGDLETAIAHAEIYGEADRELGPILAVMAAQRSGDSAVVNRYLPQVLELPSFRASGIIPRLRERITDDALIGAIVAALSRAGVPEPALTAAF